MKFPVAPESMRAEVLTVLVFPCSEIGKVIDLLLGFASSTQSRVREGDVKASSLFKIQSSWGGNFSYFLHGFFEACSEDIEDVGLALPGSL